MNRILRAVAVGLGLTTIYLAWLVEPLIKSNHDLSFHWNGSASILFGPTLVDFLIVWIVCTLLVLSAQAPGRWRIAVWSGIVITMPWVVLRNLELVWPNLVPHWFYLPNFLVAILIWVLAVVLWRGPVAKPYEHVVEFASTVLMFVAISGALFLSQFMWCWWQARSLNDPVPLHREQAHVVASAPRPRVIWIILDELSYQQVYEHRYPGLQLPAFDALAKQATVFTQVVPAGRYTERAIPSMMTGTFFDKVRSSADGRFWLHNRKTGQWQPFRQHETVFQDALNRGYSTAVAGWWNPYCRLLPAVLDHCYWTNLYQLHNGSADGTFGSNLLGSVGAMIGDGRLYHVVSRLFPLPDSTALQTRVHITDYENLSAAGDKLLRDPSVGFALIHIPVPHPQGIYDPATGHFSTGPTTYMDNLALADRYLAHVRQVLEQTGQWDSSTILVMGDHSWRTTFVWEGYPTWTKAEERASLGGKFDPRPGYIVKLAGQETGAKIDLPFHAVKTRALLDALLAGKIRTADELRGWVQQSLAAKQQAVGVARVEGWKRAGDDLWAPWTQNRNGPARESIVIR